MEEMNEKDIPRAGWAEAFAAMAENGDDALLDEDITGEWDVEWLWGE